jgi:hypothetical protein
VSRETTNRYFDELASGLASGTLSRGRALRSVKIVIYALNFIGDSSWYVPIIPASTTVGGRRNLHDYPPHPPERPLAHSKEREGTAYPHLLHETQPTGRGRKVLKWQ